MSSWDLLAQELDKWSQPVNFWWRDDDAVAESDHLHMMLALAKQYQLAVHLAVIPMNLEKSLSFISGAEVSAHAYVLQHGVSHQSFAAAGQRKIELGGLQDLNLLKNLLLQGRSILQQAFARQYLDILVPPWNRLADEVIAYLPEIGYQRLSVLGERVLDSSPAQLNVHMDIINWKARAFAGEEDVLAKLILTLERKRERGLDLSEPIGLMTHHLDHDLQCWQFIDRFLAFSQAQPKMHWLNGDALFI